MLEEGRINIVAEVTPGRPNLSKIVDRTFASYDSKIAFFVCGPPSLRRQLREEVGRYVVSGYPAYWHEETFDF
jgi:hypothetical protein